MQNAQADKVDAFFDVVNSNLIGTKLVVNEFIREKNELAEKLTKTMQEKNKLAEKLTNTMQEKNKLAEKLTKTMKELFVMLEKYERARLAVAHGRPMTLTADGNDFDLDFTMGPGNVTYSEYVAKLTREDLEWCNKSSSQLLNLGV